MGLAVAAVFGLRAQEPGQDKKTDKTSQIREDLELRERILSKQFAEFEQSLLRLMQRLKASSKKEDQEKAVILEKALEKSKDALISTQFEQLANFLKTQQLKSLGEIKDAADKSAKLAEDLRLLLALLREDSRASKLRDERLRLEQMIKEIEKLILKQKTVQGQTDIGKTERMELVKNQNKVTQATADLAKKMGGQGDGKDQKGRPKDGGKDGGKKGESKDVGKEQNAQTKDAGKAQAKQGEAKSIQIAQAPKGGEPKDGDAKSGKGGDAKKADAKGSTSGQGKQGDAKDKQGQGKEAEAKEARVKEKAKPAEAKTEEKKETKSAEAKAGQKNGDSKQAGAKGSKSGDQKSGDPKGGGQAQAKAGKSGESQAKSSGQQQQQQGQQAKSKGDNNKQQQQPGQQQPQAAQNGKKQVQDANSKQQQAEEKIAKGDNKDASKSQGDAIKDLEKAKKELEKLLNQLREEELERLLAALQARCERMLAMQLQVLAGTEQVWAAINNHADKKASRDDQQRSLKLSDDEKDIVVEASKAIEMLEAEGSAVAFPEVFKQVREDMKHVQRRLGVVDAGVVTQAIEKDIVETLKEMIEALKKARQELDNKKSPPSNSPPPPPQDQKLLDLIAELKMIRSMQIRVNTRTKIYGDQYQGEQAGEPTIVRELRNLSERQERIYEVTNKIAKGDNR
jgi:hypothetical protein